MKNTKSFLKYLHLHCLRHPLLLFQLLQCAQVADATKCKYWVHYWYFFGCSFHRLQVLKKWNLLCVYKDATKGKTTIIYLLAVTVCIGCGGYKMYILGTISVCQLLQSATKCKYLDCVSKKKLYWLKLRSLSIYSLYRFWMKQKSKYFLSFPLLLGQDKIIIKNLFCTNN